MREPENIRAVEEKAHPDMMGFIFWKGSKRYVSEPPAYLPECTRVGVFVNPTEDEVLQKVKDFGLNAIQLHGQETPDFCRTIKKRTSMPIIKAFSIGEGDALRFTLHASRYEEIADLFLFDTKCKCVGGSGEQFDWDILHCYKGETPFLLSGGIGPGDEEKVKRWHHPRWVGIDLNSRFETAPAYKDVETLAKFVREF
jgi:phosphoribosylanthranilate isomerase